jgi:hypothetical protein
LTLDLDSAPARLFILVGLPLLGALGGHLWTRFRDRLARLYWSANHTPMAFATEDIGFGKVEILHNSQPVLNIHMTRVALQNDSNRDLANVTVNIGFLEGSRILRSFGFLEGGLRPLPHAPDFDRRLAAAVDGHATEGEVTTLLSNHDYTIPVLNRGSTASFAILVTRVDYSMPVVSLSVVHPGATLSYREPVPLHFGVPRSQALLWGLVVDVIALLALWYFSPPLWVAVIVALLLGLYVLALGALAVRMRRLVVKLIS